MRKSLLLNLASLLSYSLLAQSRMSFIRETFDTDEIHAGWTTSGEGAENWSIWPTHQAGGDLCEIKLYWRPSFVGTSRLVSPAVNLTGINEMIFSFKGFLDNYMDVPHKIGIATTSDDGTTWNVAWEETFSTDLESTAKADFTFNTPLTLAPGTYNITVTILKVNDDEDVTSDNVKSMTIDAAIGTAQRIPLIEHFSSSTCAPCVYVNQSMNILTENNTVKCAMNFPLEGDPYCTAEALERKSYYNVVSAPHIFFDGKDFYTEYNRPAYVDIKGAFNMEGSVHHFTVATICENGESEQSETFEFELIGVSLDEYEIDFEIYPNPAGDFIRLSTDNRQQTTVRVYNYLGILVDEIDGDTSEIEINVSDYKSGIYFINVYTEERSATKKIIIE